MVLTMASIARVVALGASNLARGIGTVVSIAHATWGSDVQVLAALGYGRSYGTSSRVLFRILPGILESGLWQTIASLPPVETRVLVTDVGNDLLYGFSKEMILRWVEDTLNRVQRIARDVTLTGLPLESMRRLSRRKYLVFRSVLFPKSRISLDQLLETAEGLNSGLVDLSVKYGARFSRPNPEWYGIDPIHIRRQFWYPAWGEMLAADSAGARVTFHSPMDRLRLKFMAPERRWPFGYEQVSRQCGYSLSSGVRVWLF